METQDQTNVGQAAPPPAPQEKPVGKAAKPGKTPNIRELQRAMNEQQAGTDERLDSLEETLGGVQSDLSSVLDLLKGMSAQNRPHGPAFANEQESSALLNEGNAYAQFKEDAKGNHQGLELIEPTSRTLDEPAFADKMATMAFYDEPVTVMIQDTNEDEQDQLVEIAVNGRSVVFQRNVPMTVPRYIVEGLARARPFTYTNEEYVAERNIRKVRQNRKVGLRYPFTVLEDANPRGSAWLRAVLSQTT